MHRNIREEIANSLTHGLGVVLAVVGLGLLVVFAVGSHDVWRIVSCSIYGFTLVLLYSASTLYHSFRNPKVKHWFRILDHACIYLLIAGTYTPFTLVTLRGPWGWSLFGIVWTLAACGLAFKLLYIGRFPIVSVTVYMLMGWMAVVAIKPMLERLPVEGLLWLVAGGLLYTVGVVFYATGGKLRYSHAIWHVFVLGGSICHYIAVLTCVLLGARSSA
ncbi:MAG TPA: hemolysin III family protein [Acidobacteriota bacterium]|nr:hemolysin III family protein [Acidobacteriota bacterium]